MSGRDSPYTSGGSAKVRRRSLSAVREPGRIRKTLGPFGGPPQREKVVSATQFNYDLDFPRGSLNLTRITDNIQSVQPKAFATMTPPRDAPGSGTNNLGNLGVEQAIAGSTATLVDPYQRNFWGIKIDHPGFNACNPTQWRANISQFAYVKTSAVVCEITLPDAPVCDSGPVKVIRPGVMTNAQATAVQSTRFGNAGLAIWDEIRPSGAWEYIIIPPHKAASINLSNCVGLVRWQELMQLGYKPRTCKGRKYRVMCNPTGFDQSGQRDTQERLNALDGGDGVIPSSNLLATGTGPGMYTKSHSAQETDWVCQYGYAGVPDNYIGAGLKLAQFSAQGFDVVAFGSAIVFQFCQYAPPTTENVQTSMAQCIPVSLTIHNSTVFSQLKTAQRDLGQVFTLPLIGGV